MTNIHLIYNYKKSQEFVLREISRLFDRLKLRKTNNLKYLKSS